LNHHASPEFWESYRSLPISVQRLADRCYEQPKNDPRHPSLHLESPWVLFSAGRDPLSRDWRGSAKRHRVVLDRTTCRVRQADRL